MIRPRPWTLRPPDSKQPGWEALWPALADAARANAAEAPGAIHDRSYLLLQQAGVFSALVPRDQGGHEIDPLVALALIEDLATISGTLGWLGFVGVTGGLFSVELPAPGEVYADPNHLIAFAGGIHGVLTGSGDEFSVSGIWPMATGLSHAVWVAVGCSVESAEPSETAVVLLPRSACEIGPYWSAVGLPGTGTAPLTVVDAAVAADRVCYDLHADADNRRRRRFRVLIPSAIAAVSVGIGLAALDDVAQNLSQDQPTGSGLRRADSELVQDVLGLRYANLLAARCLVYEVTAGAWERAASGDDLGLELAARHRLAATHAAHVAVDATECAARLAGVGAITSGHPASSRWLDARTVLANVTVRDLYYRVYGGVAADGVIPESWP